MTARKVLFPFILTVILGAALAAPVLSQTSSITQEERIALEKELLEIEKEIAVYEKTLAVTQAQKQTLQNKIEQLKNRRAKIELQVKATSAKLNYLDKELKRAELDLAATIKKISGLKNYLSEVLRLVAQNDTYSSLAKLLSTINFSDFFLELNELNQIQANLHQTLDQYQELQAKLDRQTEDLNDKKASAAHLLSIQKIQQQEIVNAKTEQEDLLKETRGRESAYQQIISDSKKRAAEIKSRIYELVGVQKQLTFGEAVKIANWVAGQIKVRPAFLLAILSQESSLGKNVGTCNRINDPPAKSWRVVMKPERDQEPFQAITKELDLETDITPVSCPMTDRRGQRIGWGGAMGPAQFIPSTWQGYKKEVAAITGQAKADPWDIRDAFVAAALMLSRNGADKSNGEWAAAMRYFSGSTNTRFRFYGDNVLSRAKQYEKDIADLTASLTRE